MFSQFFPYDEQTWNIQEEKGFTSRILAYTPEVLMMEWLFINEGFVVPMHEHYHTQITHIRTGSAKVVMADGTEKILKAGDAVAFAPNEGHSVTMLEANTTIIDVFSPVRLDHLANHKPL